MRIGVLALQGGVAEHLYAVKAAFNKLNIHGEAVRVKSVRDLKGLDGLILPGGESTAIQRLMVRIGLWGEVKDLILQGLPVMGTCAGAVLLARSVRDREVEGPRVETLEAMNIEVVRNYFGRQRESFEVYLQVPAIEGGPFKAIFIRAPAIIKVIEPAKPLAKLGDVVVAVEEGAKLATSFHPELSGDTRLHEYWLRRLRR